jgi:hypothetical protein
MSINSMFLSGTGDPRTAPTHSHANVLFILRRINRFFTDEESNPESSPSSFTNKQTLSPLLSIQKLVFFCILQKLFWTLDMRYKKQNVCKVHFFLNQLSVSKFPQRTGCITLKPFISEHLYRKISLDQV